MMIPEDEISFRKLFGETPDDFRFQYVVNKPLTSLLFLFSIGLIVGTFFITGNSLISDAMNLLVWVVSLGVSLGLFLVLFIWRTVARRSAILFTDEALIWLDKGTVAYIAWSEMSFDSFGKALTGARATQGVMNFESSTGTKGLTIYTPYMCIDYSRRFTAEILMRLKAAEESEA